MLLQVSRPLPLPLVVSCYVKPFCYRAGAEIKKEDSDNGYDAALASNPISQLQEMIQKKRWPPPVYEFTDEFGPLHARSHTCTIHLLAKSLQGEKLRKLWFVLLSIFEDKINRSGNSLN